jgi:FixJ family two-component response regulator
VPVIEVDGLVKRYVGRAVVDGVTFSARGFNNREAAAHLFISEATVKTHRLHTPTRSSVATTARRPLRPPTDGACS